MYMISRPLMQPQARNCWLPYSLMGSVMHKTARPIMQLNSCTASAMPIDGAHRVQDLRALKINLLFGLQLVGSVARCPMLHT